MSPRHVPDGERPEAIPHPGPIESPRAPLVSCIMPTFNRRGFVPLALDNFARQDYPEKELLVIDDGTDPVEDLVAGVRDVRYIQVDQRVPIGAKRNLACSLARGQIIAHWDDDDWYAPHRLHYQVAPIVAGDADLTGLESTFVLDLSARQFWTMDHDLHRGMFVGDVHGGTLVYRKAVWDEGSRYPETNLAEDAGLLQHAIARGKRLCRLANTGVFIYVRHGRNAWSFQTGEYVKASGWSHGDPPAGFSRHVLNLYAAAVDS